MRESSLHILLNIIFYFKSIRYIYISRYSLHFLLTIKLIIIFLKRGEAQQCVGGISRWRVHGMRRERRRIGSRSRFRTLAAESNHTCPQSCVTLLSCAFERFTRHLRRSAVDRRLAGRPAGWPAARCDETMRTATPRRMLAGRTSISLDIARVQLQPAACISRVARLFHSRARASLYAPAILGARFVARFIHHRWMRAWPSYLYSAPCYAIHSLVQCSSTGTMFSVSFLAGSQLLKQRKIDQMKRQR